MPIPLIPNNTEQLLQIKTEGKNLDYKQGLNWATCSNDERAEIVKDILSMSNVQDGGRIIFGVRDNDFELVGVSVEEFDSFDQTKVNDFLHKYTDPKFTCYVYKHSIQGKQVVVIDVPEFPETPIICKQDANSSKDNKLILQKGQIYLRTEKGTSEAISSAQEMRELLGRSVAKRGDELLGNIERLIKGRPLKATEDADEKYREEIREAAAFLNQELGNELMKYGSWGLIVYPTDYRPKRIPDHQRVKELIGKSEVQLRGWNFPHTDESGNSSNFLKGRQSFTIWDRHTEGHRAYQSGLFAWKSVFWEDKEGHTHDGKPLLSFISAIWTITELLLFCKRYYEEIAPDSSLHLEIILSPTKGRQLAAFDAAVHLAPWYIAKVNSILIQEDIQIVELRASYKEIANRIVKQIFAIFNWDDADPTMIDNWQTKLIERRF